MISINVKDIRKEDAIKAHALTLTLRHFNIPNETFSVKYQDDKYYIFIGEEIFNFASFDEIPMFIFCTVAHTSEELHELVSFNQNVLKVGFNNNDALDYLNFYSESDKKLVRR